MQNNQELLSQNQPVVTQQQSLLQEKGQNIRKLPKWFFLTVFFVVLLLGGGYYVLSNQKPQTIQYPKSITEKLNKPAPIADQTANWETYKNSTWQYEVSYPPDWIVQENSNDNTYVYNKNQYISIFVTQRTKASLEEEARKEGEDHPQCAMGSPCTPAPAKQVQKKEDPRFKEFYEVINASGRKIIVFSFPTTDDYYITVNPFPTSKFFEEIPEELFTQIFSTFKFIDKPQPVTSNNNQTRKIKLFYYNEIEDRKIASYMPCVSVLPVEREIPLTNTPIQDTVNILIKGELTEAEKAQGFSTEFPNPDFKLLSLNLKNEILTLKFSDTYGFTSGGACRVGLLRSQIEKTAKQFPEVKEVIFEPEDLFQP